MSRLTWRIAGTATAGVVGVGLAIATVHRPDATTQPNMAQTLGTAPVACGVGAPSLATLARLQPNAAIAQLQASGVGARQAIAGADPSLVVISGPQGGIKPAAVQSSGPLLPVSADPTLRSCDHRLADSPRAAGLAAKAVAALEAAGLLTMADDAAPSTIYTLSDDPTNSSHVLLTVLLAQAADVRQVPPPHGLLVPLTAVMDSNSGVVQGVGRASWLG